LSKKREARIARELARKMRDQEKKARLLERFSAVQPQPKAVRFGANPDSIFNMQMAWHVEAADKAEAWSWGVDRDWGDDAWATLLEPKLNEFAQLTWKEIDTFNTPIGHKAHHAQSVDSICGEAQTRIADLCIDHDGDIFRFRLGNMRRLWGFREVNVFAVLWYDPTHQIYPTEPA
jgi:hypothetical protein